MKREKTYIDSIKDYQNKMYLPGYYVGGNIHPLLQAKTKIGGYALVILGIICLICSLFSIVSSSLNQKFGGIIGIVFSILAIIVGFKFIKINKQK